MNSLWYYLPPVFLLQESASTNALIFAIREQHLTLWIVHLAWLAGTCFDILVGYLLGGWIGRGLAGTKLGRRLDGLAASVHRVLGEDGKSLAFIALGAFLLPYLGGLACAWLRIDPKKAFPRMLLGNLLWYSLYWATNAGLRALIPNPYLALACILAATFAAAFIVKEALQRLAPSRRRPVSATLEPNDP